MPPVEAGAVAQVAAFAKRQSACASPSAVGEGIVGYDTHHRAEVVKASSISPKNLKAMLRRTKNYRSVTVNDFGREKFTWDFTDVGDLLCGSVIYPPTEICREAAIPHAGLSPQSLALGYQSKFGTTAGQATLHFGGLAAVRIFAVGPCMSSVGRLRRRAPSWRSLSRLRLLLRFFPFRSGTLSRARLIEPGPQHGLRRLEGRKTPGGIRG